MGVYLFQISDEYRMIESMLCFSWQMSWGYICLRLQICMINGLHILQESVLLWGKENGKKHRPVWF